jgi:outer membrane protein TolC
MDKTSFSQRIFIAAACTLLASCALGPDYQRPILPASNGYGTTLQDTTTNSSALSTVDEQRLAVGKDIRNDWWVLFHSPTLNALIEQAFTASPTIEIAQQALKVAQQNVYAQQGYFFRPCKRTTCRRVQN